MSYEWLKNIKVGDSVIVSNRTARVVRKVERLTKTQIILDKCMTKYRRSDGALLDLTCLVFHT